MQRKAFIRMGRPRAPLAWLRCHHRWRPDFKHNVGAGRALEALVQVVVHVLGPEVVLLIPDVQNVLLVVRQNVELIEKTTGSGHIEIRMVIAPPAAVT